MQDLERLLVATFLHCAAQPPAQSFLGVGAPEALLVAVVALVVFGPKGLADVSHYNQRSGGGQCSASAGCSRRPAGPGGVARRACLGRGAPPTDAAQAVFVRWVNGGARPQAAKSIGNTLRAFQPTIREVVEVSQDIKGTLEKVSHHLGSQGGGGGGQARGRCACGGRVGGGGAGPHKPQRSDGA